MKIYLPKLTAVFAFLFFILLWVVSLIFPQLSYATAGINQQINFEGKVVNKADGTNVTDGNYNFAFSIYNVSSAGTALWTETYDGGGGNHGPQVTVTSGIFRVSFGQYNTNLQSNVDFGTTPLYVGITFNGDGEMAPRVQLTSVPQAFNAAKVAGLTVTDDTGALITTGQLKVPNSTVATFAGGTITVADTSTTQTLSSKTFSSSLLLNANNTLDLGAGANQVRTIYLGTSFVLGTSGANNTTITFTAPTAANAITIPNAGGTVAVAGSNAISISALGAISLLTTSSNDSNATTSNNSGLIITASGAGLLRGCSDQQILKWTLSGGTWACANDQTGSGGTPVLLAPSSTQADASAANNSIDITKNVSNPTGSVLNLIEGSPVTSAYTVNDAVIKRALTSATSSESATGSVFNVINSSTLTGGSSTNGGTDLLVTNPTGTSGAIFTGNLLDLQRADAAAGAEVSKFSVSATGNVVANGTYNTNTFTGAGLTFGTNSTNTVSANANNILTLNSSSTGNIQFQNSSSFITNGGALTLGGNLTFSGASPTISSTNASTLTISSANASNIAINPGTTGQLTSTLGATSGDASAFTDNSLAAAGANLLNLTFKNNASASTGVVNGLTITQGATTNTTGNTANLINLSATAGGTVNGINFANTNFTNYLTGTNFTVTSSGNITAGTYNTSTLSGSALTFGTNGGASVNAQGTNVLTLNSTSTGNVQFLNSSSFITSGGALTINSNFTQNAGTHSITSANTSGSVFTLTDSSFTADASKLLAISVTDASGAAGATSVQGIDLTLTNGTNANNSNTINGINFPAATNTTSNTINGITFQSATGFTNFLKTPLLVIASNGQLQSTVATGTAPFTVSSTTNVANLNASSLNGATFGTPGAIGGGTAAAGTFTTLTANTSITDVGLAANGVVTNTSAGLLGTLAGTTTTVLHGNASGLPTFATVSNSDLAGGSYGSITGLGTLTALIISGSTNQVLQVTSTATTADAITFTSNSLAAANESLTNLTFKNNAASSTGAINGLTITQGATTNTTGNTANLINLSATSGGTVNGINFANTNFTNYLNGTNFIVSSLGAITAATSTNTINGAIISGSTQTFTANNIADSGSLTIKSGGANILTIDTGSAAALNIGATSNAIAIGNTTANTSLTFNSGGSGSQTHNSSVTSGTGAASAFVLNANSVNIGTGLRLSETALSTGIGLSYVAPNTTTLTTGKLINIANSTTNPHTYLSLDNRDLSIGGHINQISSGVSGTIVKTFVYATTADTDGGRWTDDERAQASSWYNEASSATRSAIKAFPEKAILIATTTNLYIYDAKDNTLWMQINKGTTTNESMIGPTTNSVGTTVFALNGRIYYGNSGTAGGLYVIDFKNDTSYKYSTTGYSLGTINVFNRNSVTPNYNLVTATPALTNVSIADVYGSVVLGKTYIAVGFNAAAGDNGSVGLINETNQTVTNFGIAANNTIASQVFLTLTGDLYAVIGNVVGGSSITNAVIKAKHSSWAKTGNNNAFDEIYGNTTTTGATTSDAAFGSLAFTAGPAPRDNTFVPNALFVVQGTSDADGKSNTIFVGDGSASNGGMVVFSTVEGISSPQLGSVKYYDSNMISEEMYGDVRMMLPMTGTGTLAASSTLTKGTDGDISVKAEDFTTTAGNQPTHTAVGVANGVRGTGLTFNGSTQFLCAGTAGTCATSGANITNADFTTGNFSISFWAEVANGYSTASTAVDHRVNGAGAGYFGQFNASANKFTFTISDGANTAVTTSGRSVNDGNWHQYNITWSRANAATCAATTNPCTLSLYIDGQLDTATANTNVGSITASTGRLTLMANSATTTAAFVTGSMDEFTLTAQVLNTGQIAYDYLNAYRALQNHPSGGRTLRGTTITQDNFNKLNGTSSQVAGLVTYMELGETFIGTTGSGTGGVSVIGLNCDCILDNLSTATTDDNGTAFASNTIQNMGLFITRGYGTGYVLGIANSTTGIWIESTNTILRDFITQTYNPFGSSLIQSKLDVDQVFRVMSQLSDRTDNYALNQTAYPQFSTIFQVDPNGITFGTVPTYATGANTGFTAATNSITANTATVNVGNTASTDNNNRTVLNVQNGGSGFVDLELIRGMINYQQTNWFDEEFNGKALDTTNKMNNAAAGTGATCAVPANTTNLGGQYQMTTGTATGTAAGCSLTTLATLTNGFYQRGNNPIYESAVKMGSTANTQRAYFGFTSAIPTGDANTANHAFIEKQAGDTNWRCSVADGTTERTILMNTAPNSAPISTTTFQRLRVTVMAGTTPQVVCSVDNASVVINTNLPGATTAMDLIVRSESNGTSAGPHAVDYVRTWQDDPPLTVNSSESTTTSPTTSANSSVSDILTNLQNTAIVPLVLNPGHEQRLEIRNSAGNQVIAFDDQGNAILSGTLTAKTVKADTIEGLQIITDQISSLSAKVNSTQTSTASVSAHPTNPVVTTTNSNKISVESAQFINLSVLGTLEASGGLAVNGPTHFGGDNIFDKLALFLGNVIFRGQVSFETVPVFSSDTAGYATIHAGSDRVEVSFDQAYQDPPIVNINFSLEPVILNDGTIEPQSVTEKRIFGLGLTYFVSQRSQHGFVIILNKPATEDLRFVWTALAVKNAKTFQSTNPAASNSAQPAQ